MHYIRLMRPPSLDEHNRLKLVLTITTDLGDSFLCPESPVPISVYVQHSHTSQTSVEPHKVKIDDGSVTWRSGMRILKLDLPITGQVAREIQILLSQADAPPRIHVVASQRLLNPPDITAIPFDEQGRVIGLSAPLPVPGQEPCYTARRDFAIPGDSYVGIPGTLSLEEEIGESIDRHVWDAGVVTAGLLAGMCRHSNAGSKWYKMPLLQTMLDSVTLGQEPLKVIELGCGVGILGIGLGTALSLCLLERLRLTSKAMEDDAAGSRDGPSDEAIVEPAKSCAGGPILLTDLPDAEELARTNIEPFLDFANDASSMSLNFESLDWEDGKDGMFGHRTSTTCWDLIIISDCTYNVDMLSALVKTLSALHDSSLVIGDTAPKVMLATKPRHASERALFDLMKAENWEVLESAREPLPVLGMEDEVVEIYLFAKQSSGPEGDGKHLAGSVRG